MHESEKGDSSRRYRIFETRQFLDDLSSLGPLIQKRMEAKLRNFVYRILQDDPHMGPNIKRMKNWEPPTWRYRIADWRFFYEINEEEGIVFMVAADHRKQSHR
jgi:mRNA interferase RelE/StbE